MVFTHGKNAVVFAGGYNLTHYLRTCALASERDMADASTFSSGDPEDGFKRYVPGLNDSVMSMEGLHDGNADEIDKLLFEALFQDSSKVFSYCPRGMAHGSNVYSLMGFDASYEVSSDIGEVNAIAAEVQADQVVQLGRIVHPFGAEASAGNGVTLDGTAATTKGGYLFIHQQAGTGVDYKLQDSADGTTWADLGTFAISGRGDDMLFVAGTVRRYTRVVWDAAATFAAIVARGL